MKVFVLGARRDGPAAAHAKAAVRQHRHADDVSFQDEEVHHRRAVAGQVDARPVAGGQAKDRRPVEARHYQFHMVPSSRRATGNCLGS